MGYVSDFLGRRGIARGDAVALALGNGPEAAAAFLAVADAAVAAPLNPAYQDSEVAFFLTDLHARALIVDRDSPSRAASAARACGVPVVTLVPCLDRPAGAFSLEWTAAGPLRSARPAERSEDVALLLHTSGTTSRPKLVPLTRDRLCLSARQIGRTLALAPTDVCLNVMPLFHVHGLVGAVLATLSAGGSVWCSPGFNALRFFAWLEQSEATWYTAVPTIHQTVLARGREHDRARRRHRLRFVRSSSAPLVEGLWQSLEDFFCVPALNAYGMTEATHQIASNPLPPRARKPRTVGLSTGPEIGVMDESGCLLPPGSIGEVVLRGDTVMVGYEQPIEANAAAFCDGWFRTGDQGALDTSSYLTLTGRLKELINSGGEKISPYEIEAVLLQHPAVAQAVSFAVPHSSLGEAVGVAVVLRENQQVTERALRRFAADRLAKFKTPRRIVMLDELPRGATGKLQRVGLARRLNVDAS